MYAIYYKTESGDSGFAGVYKDKPTEAHLFAIAEQYNEIYDGECYMSFEVEEVKEVLDLPAPYSGEPVSFL